MQLQEHILCQFIGRYAVAQKLPGDAVNHAFVRVHHAGERRYGRLPFLRRRRYGWGHCQQSRYFFPFQFLTTKKRRPATQKSEIRLRNVQSWDKIMAVYGPKPTLATKFMLSIDPLLAWVS